MSLALNAGKIDAARLRSPRWAALAAVLAASALFMFADARPEPIQLWDESRVMVNALEMHARGWSLLTTYAGRPDLWNTKPPLLVWAMNASLHLFGVSTMALRLPSMLAALGVVAITFAFVRRLSGSRGTGALAAGLLTLSFGFSGLHAARTADYDAPLALFTTGYGVLLLFLLHRRRPGVGRLTLAAVLVVGAGMTKSVAGLVPGTGVGLYLLAVGRWRRPLSPAYALAGWGVATVLAGFLWAREQAAPGYLHAALFNDVSGRFGAALDRHAGSPLYYALLCFGLGFFSAGPLGLLAPAGLIWAKGRVRLGLVFSLCMAAGVLGIDSAASTKLPQYAVPAYPFLAAACAFAVHAGLRACSSAKRRNAWSALGVALLLITGVACGLRYLYLPPLADPPQARYGRLFESLRAQGEAGVQVLDSGVLGPGVVALGVPDAYAPQLEAYRLIWRTRGLDAARASGLSAMAKRSVAATCDPFWLARVRHTGRDVGGVRGCAAVRR